MGQPRARSLELTVTWTFAHTTRLTVGAGCWREAPARVATYGRRALLVTGAESLRLLGISEELDRLLAAAGVAAMRVTVAGEPDTELVDAIAETARTARCDVVLAVGGGSVMDAAKGAAAMAVNAGPVRDRMEGLEQPPVPLEVAPLPVLCVPTTAGTGSEVTRNAVLTVPDRRVKRSLRDERLTPREAFIDPLLAAGGPLTLRAACGFDALTHLIEAFCSTAATPLSDALARDALPRAMRGLRALADGGRHAAQAAAAAAEDLALAALAGGICLGNAGLGAAHGLVAPLGGLYPRAPHGAALACLLPATLVANEAALAARAPDSPARARLTEVAAAVVGPGAGVGLAARTLVELRKRLGLPGLASYGVADLDAIVAAPSGSLRTNPIVLTPVEMRILLANALPD